MNGLMALTGIYHDYFWFVLRCSGLVLTAPLLSAEVLPKTVKLILVLVMALFLKSTINTTVVPVINLGGVFLIGQEILIGMIIGFVLSVVFQSFILGGHVVAMQSGMGFASFVDPSTNQTMPVYSQLYLLLVSLIFLCLDGHLLMLKLLINSYNFIPLNYMTVNSNWFWQVCQFSSWIFLGGVIVAIPAIIGLLIVNLIFSVITRAAPQMNIFAIGFPITIVLGAGIVYLTINSIAPHVNTATQHALSLLMEILTP